MKKQCLIFSLVFFVGAIHAQDVVNNKKVASVVQDYLLTVQSEVNKIINPATGDPVQITDFDAIYEAAGKLDSKRFPEDMMFVIQTLLGRAGSVDKDAPDATYPLTFPQDHHMHANMGREWYYIAGHMQVTDEDGNTGRIAILMSILKIRAVGLTAQANAGWTDEEVTVATNVATLTVDMGVGKRKLYRRSPNSQWPLKKGVVKFSSPGENFMFQVGPDSISGSTDVLPLSVTINDEKNMQVELLLYKNSTINPNPPYFLQGEPVSLALPQGGTGLTLTPKPGIYYSWPQLDMLGKITIEGKTYNVTSGSGWIDHQLMMTSLQNADDKVHPVPFVEDPSPYNGWIWQYFNLNNGQAFTTASFIEGEMKYDLPEIYGYLLTPQKDGAWLAAYIVGNNKLLSPTGFPALIGKTRYRKNNPTIEIPLVRAYKGLGNAILPLPLPLTGVATPWCSEGTFSGADWGLIGEFAADYTDLTGNYTDGVGFMESVGFEKVEDYRAFALEFLKKGRRPSNTPR